jgi:hypothetical protein
MFRLRERYLIHLLSKEVQVMRMIWIVTTVFSLVTIGATAQELAPIPKAEVFANYSYLRVGPSPGYGAANIAPGFRVSGALNINPWLGFVVDTGHHFGQQAVIPCTRLWEGPVLRIGVMKG